MDKELKLEGIEKLPKKTKQIFVQFFECYKKAVGSLDDKILQLFLNFVLDQYKSPFAFAPYHKKIRKPFDYYEFSLDFVRPLIDKAASKLYGQEVLDKIKTELENGENVILLANHQTEADPQAIAILLEESYPQIGEKIIYVAGERVVTDPLAVPFSMGTDLLCIYSKRYIDSPPELKAQKQLHNKNTMTLMSALLKEGGKIIYVAPSGGRDRKNKEGIVEIAPFDPQSIEMFYLMAKKAKTPTHFYPFTLSTYELMPPPETIQKELGERRTANRCPIQIAFAKEFNMEVFPQSGENDKNTRRLKRAEAIWDIVNENYKRIK